MNRRFSFMGRRAARGGSGAASVPMLYGATGWSDSDYYEGDATEYGHADGFALAVPFLLASIPGDFCALGGNISGTSAGNFLQVRSADDVIAQMRDGSGLRSSASYALGSGDVGKLHLAMLYFTGSALRLWMDRAQVGSDASASGYTASAAPFRLGRRSTGSGFNGGGGAVTIFGAVAFRGTASPAEIEAFYDAFKASAALPTMLGGMTLMRSHPMPADAPASFAGLTRVGTLTPVSLPVSGLDWAW